MNNAQSRPGTTEPGDAGTGLPLIYHCSRGHSEFVGITHDEVEDWLLRHSGSVHIRPYVDRALGWYDLDPNHPYYPEHSAAGWDGYLHSFWRARPEPIRHLPGRQPAGAPR